MKRNLTLAVVAVAAAVLLAGAGTALAQFVQCNARLGGECRGTAEADRITGSIHPDQIFAGRGDDEIREPLVDGDNDEIRGGGGNDDIRDFNPAVDVDTVFGGKGDDFINVREGLLSGGADVVDCGPGNDTVFFDPSDTVTNCEIKNPQ